MQNRAIRNGMNGVPCPVPPRRSPVSRNEDPASVEQGRVSVEAAAVPLRQRTQLDLHQLAIAPLVDEAARLHELEVFDPAGPRDGVERVEIPAPVRRRDDSLDIDLGTRTRGAEGHRALEDVAGLRVDRRVALHLLAGDGHRPGRAPRGEGHVDALVELLRRGDRLLEQDVLELDRLRAQVRPGEPVDHVEQDDARQDAHTMNQVIANDEVPVLHHLDEGLGLAIAPHVRQATLMWKKSSKSASAGDDGSATEPSGGSTGQ
jgi:hypothetical protein